MRIKIIAFVLVIMFTITTVAYADRLVDLQQEYHQIQTRIQEFKEMRLVTDLEFRAVIRNLQNDLQRFLGAIKEVQRIKTEEKARKAVEAKALAEKIRQEVKAEAKKKADENIEETEIPQTTGD